MFIKDILDIHKRSYGCRRSSVRRSEILLKHKKAIRPIIRRATDINRIKIKTVYFVRMESAQCAPHRPWITDVKIDSLEFIHTWSESIRSRSHRSIRNSTLKNDNRLSVLAVTVPLLVDTHQNRIRAFCTWRITIFRDKDIEENQLGATSNCFPEIYSIYLFVCSDQVAIDCLQWTFVRDKSSQWVNGHSISDNALWFRNISWWRMGSALCVCVWPIRKRNE